MNLPMDLLRSFVAIIETGSMQRATERVHVTQSAISLQMKRLEDLLQVELFVRDGRKLALASAGTELLPLARDILSLNDRAIAALSGDAIAGPLRVGVVQDFAETILSGVLSRFAALHPNTQIQVRVAGSPELLDLVNAEKLDVVFCMAAADDPAASKVVPMVWHGDEALAASDILPVAVLETPCRFRDSALRALERSGRKFRIALETPSLSALRAAIDAGLAVTCRTTIFRSAPPIEDGILPTLPRVAYVRHIRAPSHPTFDRIADLIQSAVIEDGAEAAL